MQSNENEAVLKEIANLKKILDDYNKGQINHIEVLRKIKDLYNLAPKEDILKEIQILEEVAKTGDGKKFKQQLDIITTFFKTKEEPYKPINDIFLTVYNSQVTKQGISTLCPELDRVTGGLLSGNICTIAGITGSMKTTYAVNICYNAVKKGQNVCYMSLEEPPLQLYSKILSRASVDCNYPLLTKNVVQNNLTDKEKETLEKEVYPYLEQLQGTFYILGERDLINYDPYEIEIKLEELDMLIKEKSKQKENGDNHGIDILVVDHIQLLKYADGQKDEYKLVNMYVDFFRRLSLAFSSDNREILVILLSQINRQGIAYSNAKKRNKNGDDGLKHDGEYLLQHVAEASEIERSSSYILTVYTDPMIQITKLLKVGALKLRGSQLPMNTIQIYADGAYYQVGDTEIPEQQNYSTSIILGDSSLVDKKTVNDSTARSSTDLDWLDTLLKGVQL